MKTTSILVSMLFGFAVAAPVNKRDLHTKTSTVIQTEVVYTTVYDGEVPESTSSAAAFFEESTESPVVAPTTTAAAPTTIKTSVVAVPTTTAPVVQPSSEAPKSSEEPKPTTTAPVVVPTTTQAPATTAAPTTTAAPAPVQPTTSAVVEAAATTSAAAAAAPTSGSSSSSGSGGDVHTGGSMTLNYFQGGLGSCGKPIADTDMTVALASDLYGASTYDVATGNPTNPWCGKSVAITYNGKTTIAKIMDKCPGCTNGGFDMTPAVWEAVTGSSVGDRITGMTWTTV